MCSPYFPQTNFREEGEKKKKKKKQGFFLPPPIFTLLNLTAELFSVLTRGEVTDFFLMLQYGTVTAEVISCSFTS